MIFTCALPTGFNLVAGTLARVETNLAIFKFAPGAAFLQFSNELHLELSLRACKRIFQISDDCESFEFIDILSRVFDRLSFLLNDVLQNFNKSASKMVVPFDVKADFPGDLSQTTDLWDFLKLLNDLTQIVLVFNFLQINSINVQFSDLHIELLSCHQTLQRIADLVGAKSTPDLNSFRRAVLRSPILELFQSSHNLVNRFIGSLREVGTRVGPLETLLFLECICGLSLVDESESSGPGNPVVNFFSGVLEEIVFGAMGSIQTSD